MHMNWWVLRRQLHVSWLIAIFCGAIIIGLALARSFQVASLSSIVFFLLGMAISIVGLSRRYLYLIPIVIIGGVIVGIWRGSVHNIDLSDMAEFYGRTATLSGRVMEDVDSSADGQSTVRLNDLTYNNQNLHGSLWATIADNSSDIKRSDRLTISGKVSNGFGSFAGVIYKANLLKITRPKPGDWALAFRDWFASGVRQAIPDPAASLGIGYLVGQKRALPIDLIEALKIAGLTHVVVASGYNLTILVRLARRLFEKVSKYLAALSAGLMILGFVSITGLSPSMTRAALVASLSLAAWYYGRKFHPLVLLPMAATITVIINPSYLWGDLGWQLSFAAFAGVMILAPLLQRYFFGDSKPGIIRQILGETISATILTAPILISAFGQISNVSLIANLLVLPFVPLAMLLTFIGGIGAMIVPGWAMLVGWPATTLLNYMIWIAKELSKLSWATTELQVSGLIEVICYILIIGLCLYLWRATRYNLAEANIIE